MSICICGEINARNCPVHQGETKPRVRSYTHHGMRKTKIYGIWCSMKGRCFRKNDKRFAHYGGRGITVCDRWLTFENFYADMGERPEGLSLDRINNDGNYEPSNCRWADKQTQARNKRNITGTLPYRGVYLQSSENGFWPGVYQAKLQTHINKKRKSYHLGSFQSAVLAAIAYDNFARKQNPPFTLNFPNH